MDYPDTEFKHFKSEKLKKSWINIIINDYKTHIKNERDKKNKRVKKDNSDEFIPELDNLFSNISLYFSSLYNAMLSTDDLSKEFDSLTKNLFEDTDTIYKKAVDANYVSDKSAFG